MAVCIIYSNVLAICYCSTHVPQLFCLGIHTTPVAGVALHLLSPLYVSQPVQHQAEQQTQQQRRPHLQQQAQGRNSDLEDSRSRDGMEGRSGTDGQEPDSSRQRDDGSRQRDSNRPDSGSSRRRDVSSERTGRKRDSRDREQQANADNPRSQRSERGLNGGDDSNQSSHGRSGRWEGEEEGGRGQRVREGGTEEGGAPAEFDLRATLNAAKRLKLAQAGEAGKQR